MSQSTMEAILAGLVEKEVTRQLAAASKGGKGTAKAASPKAGATKATMIGEPSQVTEYGAYFSDEQIEAGEGYRCTASQPCDRLLKGTSRTGHGPKGHKPSEA